MAGCMKVTLDPAKLDATKAALLKALGEKDITVIFAQCSSFKAMIEGPRDQVEKAVEKQKDPEFCFKVEDVEICTMPKPPAPAPATPAPAAPAPAPKAPA